MDVQTVYMTCMIGGILLLLSSIVFSAAGDFFDFAVFDFFIHSQTRVCIFFGQKVVNW